MVICTARTLYRRAILSSHPATLVTGSSPAPQRTSCLFSQDQKNQQSCSVSSSLSEFTVSVSMTQRVSLVRLSLMRTVLVVQVPLHRFSFFFFNSCSKMKEVVLKKTLTTSADIVKPVNITRVLLTTSLNKHPSSDHKYSPVQSTHRHRGPGSHRVPPFPRGSGFCGCLCGYFDKSKRYKS